MIPVYRARHLAEAQLLVEHLERQGIETYIRNQDLLGTELSTVVLPEVCVLEERDFERARTISLEYESLLREEVIGEDRPCPRCRAENPPNFETCWSCREAIAR
jgi:hypothetical protein